MKIILSPSKTQTTPLTLTHPNKLPVKPELTQRLFQMMTNMSKPMMAKQMKIQGDLLDNTYQFYQQFDSSHPMHHAIDVYQGVVFQELKKELYHEKQYQYMLGHIVILSAMYSVVEPDTGIWPYRLDLTVKPNGLDLYDYWQDTVDQYFAQENVIVNLASEEFHKWVKAYEHKTIHIHFGVRQAHDKLRVISYHAKKCRGMMAHLMITHQISANQIQQIKEFVIEGHQFDEQRSNENHYYFVK
jgi:cytoplasmic iron level regulating protein YaaA (DUF328/UPF0246 family)